MPADRSNTSVGGIIALGVAVLLYTWSLLFSALLEPFLIVGMLVLFLLGLFLIARASAAASYWPDPFRVRLQGPGRQETKEREHWLHVQTQRGRSIRTVILSILIASLALFLLNHVTGSICCHFVKQAKQAAQVPAATPTPATTPPTTPTPAATTPTPQPAAPIPATPTPTPPPPPTPTPTPTVPETPGPTPTATPAAPPAPTATPAAKATLAGLLPCRADQEMECEPLSWKSHADRAEDDLTSLTQTGNNLAQIALTHGILPSLIGPKNPGAVLITDQPLASALGIAKDTPITIEAASQKLVNTPAQLATQFATTPLQPGQLLKIPSDRPYDPRQWIDWLLWALIGMSAYLLIEVARHLRNVAQGEGDFLAETSWYWAQLATGPLIAFVILLLFVHINVDLLTGDEAALQVNLRDYPTDLLLVPAFLLGFYGRVTREVLDQLMKRIFAGAWRAANGDFEIVIKGQDASDVEVSSSAPVFFETKPPLDGTQWSATDGMITSAGVFTPPQVSAPKQVFITAASPGTNRSVVKAVTVVKHKFKITAKDNAACVLHPGQKQTLAIDPQPAQEEPEITWELVPPPPAGVSFEGETKGKKEVVLVVPQDLATGTVVIKATVAGLSRTISCEITTGLSIQAEENGQKLEQKAKVAKGTKVKLTAGNVPPEQAAQITWKAEPEAALTFDSTTGPEVTGTVNGNGAAIAEHPQKGKARFELTV